jgi:hypothetical protein
MLPGGSVVVPGRFRVMARFPEIVALTSGPQLVYRTMTMLSTTTAEIKALAWLQFGWL